MPKTRGRPMPAETKKTLSCAIYTRKSSEEGLEQEFNSLHAQREACEAFVLSQRHEGWKVLATHYDDGGFSGGNMDRPALKQLLADIKARKVDVVVVYKVDRLTRALSDFAKIVETFDGHGVSFVSVTQQFNTTTSMGRLTLNVLLSFAQFEREVTGERIRDKVAASRRKGMWMGGTVPLGYDLKEQRYVVNPPEAELVRRIFDLYIECGCVRKVAAELKRKGLKTKVRVYKSGRVVGGISFSRGHLYYLLSNRTYLGEAVHRGSSYPAQHEPIIDPATWDRVHSILKGNAVDRIRGVNAAGPSLLAGFSFDDRGNRLSPTHTVKRGVRHRYYFARPLLENRPDKVGQVQRLPAHQLEGAVQGQIASFLSNPNRQLEVLLGEGATASQIQRAMLELKKLNATLPKTEATQWRKFLLDVVISIVVAPERIIIDLDPAALRVKLGMARDGDQALPENRRLALKPSKSVLRLELSVHLKKSGQESKLLIGEFEYETAQRRADPVMIKTIVRAHEWNREFLAGRSTTEIAKKAKVHRGFVAAVIPLAFLAPSITESALDGKQPRALTVKKLIRTIPVKWIDQLKVLGLPPNESL